MTEATAPEGGVFIDNLLLASVGRAMTGAYDDVADKPELPAAAAPSLLAHDLVNLANFVEALVCHEHLYVNAAFVELWRRDLQPIAPDLESLITAVEWTREWQWEAESAVVRNESWPRQLQASHFGLRELSNVVSMATHHSYGSRGIETYVEDLTAYSERTRPFGSGMDLVVGTGFYTTCSQILAIPYRPSFLRALYLRGLLKQSLRDFREDIGRLAFGMLEDARERSLEASRFFAHIADMNQVEAQMPAVLAWVLSRADSRADIIPCALALRNTEGARRFRKWNGALVTAVQSGDLADAARRFREMANLVRDVNRNLGLDEGGEAVVGLGWGPASIGKTFNLPARLNLPVRFKRHALFLQDVYRTMLGIGRLQDHIDTLIVKPLPRSFQRFATDVDWRRVASAFHDYGDIYEPVPRR